MLARFKKALIWFGTFGLLSIYFNIQTDGSTLSSMLMVVFCLVGSYIMSLLWGVYYELPTSPPFIIEEPKK